MPSSAASALAAAGSPPYGPSPTHSAPDVRPAAACVTCGEPTDAPFCPACGERRAADRPRDLRALGDEAWDAFSPVDGRVARTLASMVRRPGELTAAYMRGVRLPFVPPLRLFLLVNVLFFLHASFAWEAHVRLPGLGARTIAFGGNRTFDTPLFVHLNATAHRHVARRMLERHVPPRRDESDALYLARVARDYAPRFDAASTTQAKSLVIAMVPMFAVLVAALEWRRRRYVLQDLVFALHAMALMLGVMMVGRYLVGIPLTLALAYGGVRQSDPLLDVAMSLPLLAALLLWLRAALRRAYGDGPVAATLKALALTAGFPLVLFAYRALLFVTTLWAT